MAEEPDDDHSITLVIENLSLEPSWLEEGHVLGKIYSAVLQPPGVMTLNDIEKQESLIN